DRFEQFDVSPLRQTSQPTEFAFGFMAIVVAFDRDDRNPGFPQPAQTVHGLIHRLRLDFARVEEVARDQHERYILSQRVTFDAIAPGVEEIARAVLRTVTTDSQMDVSDVEKFDHGAGSIACDNSNRLPETSKVTDSLTLLG